MTNQFTINLIFILFSSIHANNLENIVDLQSTGETYYKDGDYKNAIIVYESLLEQQEIFYNKNDIEIAETLYKLGELYQLTNLPDIADYYFNESITIFQTVFEINKNSIELPLINLLKIYEIKNDTLMIRNTKKKLNNIATIFQLSDINDSTFIFDSETDYSAKDDLAIDKMNLGISYIDRGLYSEASIQFNDALNIKSKNLNLQFFEDFFSLDSSIKQNMINAFYYQKDFDTTGSSYFYLAFFNSSTDDAYKYSEKYTELQPMDIRGTLLYSNLFFNNKDWFNALFQYRKSLWINNNNFEATFGIGMCLFHLKDYDNAILYIRKSLKIDPYNHKAYYYLGLSSMHKLDYDNAISSLTQSLLLDPNNVDTYFNLGKSYFKSGKIIQAKEAFSRTINIDKQYGSAYYYLGHINENIMEFENAIKFYTSAREYSCNIKDLHYRLGILLYKTGYLKKAMEPLREYIILQPDSTHVLEIMGNIFVSESRFQEAIDTYNRIRSKYPEKLDINLALADSYYKLKKFENAIDIYKSILLFDDENVEVMLKMGSIYNEMGLYEQAENIFIESINCTTPTIQIYYQLAMTYGNQSKFMSAILSLQEALVISPNDLKIKYQLGVAHMELNNFYLASEYFEKYVTHHSSDHIAFFLLGKCYYQIEDFLSSLLVLEKAHNLYSSDYKILYYLGKSYFGLGEDSDAALSFRKALKINPEDSELHFALGRAYHRLNKNKKVNETLDILSMLDRSLYDKLYKEVRSK